MIGQIVAEHVDQRLRAMAAAAAAAASSSRPCFPRACEHERWVSWPVPRRVLGCAVGGRIRAYLHGFERYLDVCMPTQ
eukprot:3696013-Prymnesium_polylepis.1